MDTIQYCADGEDCPVPCGPQFVLQPEKFCGTGFDFAVNSTAAELGPCDAESQDDHLGSGVAVLPLGNPPVACRGMRYPAAWLPAIMPGGGLGCGYDGSKYVPEVCAAPGNWEYSWGSGGTADVIPFNVVVKLYDKNGAFISIIATIPVHATTGPGLNGSGTFSHGTNGQCEDYFFIVVSCPTINQTVGNVGTAIVTLCNTDVNGVGCSS